MFLVANITLGSKRLPRTNTLAFLSEASGVKELMSGALANSLLLMSVTLTPNQITRQLIVVLTACQKFVLSYILEGKRR